MIQQVLSNASPKITGKEFEELILFRARLMNESGLWHFGRYGVQVSYMRDKETGKPVLQPLKSLPDFEGVIPPTGQQIVIEAKVCTDASYPISTENDRKKRQMQHLLDRSRMGALSWLLIHFNERVLQRLHDEPFTIALPVYPESELLRDVFSLGTKRITRNDAMMYGVQVPWNVFGPRGRKQTPDLSVLMERGF